MPYLKLALALLVILGGVAFHLRNGQTVSVDFYLASYELPLSLALALAVLGGALLAVLAGLPARIRLKLDKARLARDLNKYQQHERLPEDKSAN